MTGGQGLDLHQRNREVRRVGLAPRQLTDIVLSVSRRAHAALRRSLIGTLQPEDELVVVRAHLA